MTDTLYMDHQATTPVEKSVLSAMSDYWEKSFGNPTTRYLHQQPMPFASC